MLISATMNNRINEQIVHEFYSHNLYLSMAGNLENRGLKILASRMFLQADEERMHAMKYLKFLLDVGGTVEVRAIPATTSDFPTVTDVFQKTLDHELLVTRLVNEISILAQSEGDFATLNFNQWFVNEQIEEVSSFGELLQLVKMGGEDHLLEVESRVERMMMVTAKAAAAANAPAKNAATA